MLVVPGVRDVEPDLVQARAPLEQLRRQRILELPGGGDLLQEATHGRLDPPGLRDVDVVARLHRGDRALARILVRQPADHVPQDAVAHRALGDVHALAAEDLEDLGEDRGIACELLFQGFETVDQRLHVAV